MRRNRIIALSLFTAAAFVVPGLAEEVTLPAVASIVGGAPFYSDVRAFNTSYSASLNVTATYRCFIGTCPSPAPSRSFALAPRQSMSFNDMVAGTFSAPNTAGGVEFGFSGLSDQLVVTSRLYSTSPTPTVGMFIPGLENGRAHQRTILTSIRNGGTGQGFRTNVGVFNPGDSSVDVTFTLQNETGNSFGAGVTRTVPGHSGVQVSGIFAAANVGGTATSNATIAVAATGDVFSYAAVIDNATTDPIFVVGAEDQTPTGGGSAQTRTVTVPAGVISWMDDQSHTSDTTVHVGDTVQWTWSDSAHGVVSGTCSGTGGGGGGYVGGGNGTYGYGQDCTPDGLFSSGTHSGPFTYSYTFTQAGTYPYYCGVHQSMMKGRVVVQSN
jgi:plastocyanin